MMYESLSILLEDASEWVTRIKLLVYEWMIQVII